MSLFGKKGEHDSSDNHEHPSAKPHLTGKYGIEEVTLLMRTLPVEKNPELVVLVLKNTLQSMNVNLRDIIQDAVTKEQSVGRQISDLKETIAKLEAEIGERKREVTEKEAALAEATRVKERLEAAAGPDDSPVPFVAVGQAATHSQQ